MPPDALKALDTWIDEEGAQFTSAKRMKRPEALRRLAIDALIGMGLYKPR